MDIVTYALAKKMVASASSGIVEIQTDGTNIRFKTANGEWFSVRLNSVDGATVSSNGHLIIELTDGTTLDAGVLPVGTMDSTLSTTSENGVQNKVITNALNSKQNTLTASTGITIDNTDPSNPTISANVDYTNLINKPTKLSDFTNDEDFIDNTVNNLTNYYLKTETYTQSEVNDLISQLTSLSVDIVEELPTTDISTTTIYLINVSGTNNYNQWMYINNTWANLGSTSVDLTNYYTKVQTDTLLDSKVDKVIGKGLSTNDFTNDYKSILDNYTVDSTLDSTSTNPIQNSTVTVALNTKQPKTLSSPIIIGGVTSATVESALGNLNSLCDTKLPMVTSLPLEPSNQETVLYIGTSSGGLKSGGIYQYQVSEWVLISYAESFTFNDDDFDIDSSTNEVSLLPSRRVYNGTTTEWGALTTEEKIKYGATAFTDDEGGDIDAYSTNEVKTNKVWIDGKPIYRLVSVANRLLDGNDVQVAGVFSRAIADTVDTLIKFTALGGRTAYPGQTESAPMTATFNAWQSTSDNRNIYCNADNKIYSTSVIVEYTKTTD
jgi:hypothetical protein